MENGSWSPLADQLAAAVARRSVKTKPHGTGHHAGIGKVACIGSIKRLRGKNAKRSVVNKIGRVDDRGCNNGAVVDPYRISSPGGQRKGENSKGNNLTGIPLHSRQKVFHDNFLKE